MAMSFNFGILTQSNSMIGSSSDKDNTASNNTEEHVSLISSPENQKTDGFGNKDIAGTFDESKITPELVAQANAETVGSIAMDAETVGSIACLDAETAGSAAMSAETAGSAACFDGGFSDGGFSDGGFMG